MGRILEYVILLSSLSLTLASEQYLKGSQSINYEREREENFTLVAKPFPKDQNDAFNKKILPLQNSLNRRKSNQMLSSAGLHAYAINGDIGWNGKTQNSSERGFRFIDPSRREVSLYSQKLLPRKNGRNFYSEYFPSQKLSRLNSHNAPSRHNNYNNNNQKIVNSFNDQNNYKGHISLNNYNSSNANNQNKSDNLSKRFDNFNRRYHRDGRIARHHRKVCDPCNSVPWVPLLKVPDSYRQQRTHITELHPTPQQNLNIDFHSFSSNVHNVLLPPVPLPPPIYDGTISSSFGLPVGNIPTSHGLLAPIASEITNYAIDYSNPFNYYTPPSLLDSNNFPELSPVPIVPIHDSGQFFHVDTSIPDLVPPKKPIDVSNVVLTISEQNPTDLRPPNHKYPQGDLTSKPSSVGIHSQTKQHSGPDFGKLEIVKSIPIAEFTTSVNVLQHHQQHQQQQQYHQQHQQLHQHQHQQHENHQELPLYPPLQSQYSNDFNFDSDHSSSGSEFLVPPVSNEITFNSHNSSDSKTEYLGEASAPKPLTSPSLSWLFSDHTSPSADSKGTESVTSVVTDVEGIASVVNNELRPVPSPKSPKKIQIIIPYTTKDKTGHDSSAFESVRHEVYQSPVNKTLEKNTTADTDDEHNGFRYRSEMHHIIATNLRELLREEIEKSQNYPLQKNIDNWTALEYSNHKTVDSKAPKDVIAQALAVTSIPGTSISHLLLPSKKIPNEYFATTPIPVYDEPHSPIYKVENSTVNSRPFTAKPYATTNIYNPKSSNTSRSSKETALINHEKNYTEVERERVNAWKRINENLVLPEARTRTTSAEWTNTRYTNSPRTEKIQIVTPISVTSQRNHTVSPTFRRTTRHIQTTTAPTPRIRKPLLLNRLNSTKLEKVSNQTSPFNRKFTYNSTTTTTTTISTTVTTTTTAKSSARTPTNGTNSTVSVVESDVTSNATSEVEHDGSSNKGEQVSINDIFPFRNKELPWESTQNGGQPVLRIGRQRKSLIKQSNLQKSKIAVTST